MENMQETRAEWVIVITIPRKYSLDSRHLSGSHKIPSETKAQMMLEIRMKVALLAGPLLGRF